MFSQLEETMPGTPAADRTGRSADGVGKRAGSALTYRLVAIDLDGTLLCPRGRVTQRVRQAIDGARRAGLVVCLATGRNPTESRTALDALGYADVGIFAGGALIYDCGAGRCVHRTLMEPAVAAAVCEMIEAAGHVALALQDADTAGIDYLLTEDIEPNPSTSLWMAATQCAVRSKGRLAKAGHEHTVRVGLVADPRDVAPIYAAIQARFGEQIYSHSIDVPGQLVQVMEVFHHSANKWRAVCQVAAEHGIAQEEIAAVGDGVNDLHMLRSAGLGVAMGNAPAEVRDVAHRVIATNADEGLAAFLEELTQGLARSG